MRPDRIMKKDLLQFIEMFKNQGVDFKNTPPLFRWSYPEHPELMIELLIVEPDITEVAEVMEEQQNAPSTEVVQ